MKHTFVLRYELPTYGLPIEPAINALDGAGLKGAVEVDCLLSLQFEREADLRLDAVEAAKAAVLEVIPRAVFLKVQESPWQ